MCASNGAQDEGDAPGEGHIPGALASELGVSRRTISKYEVEDMRYARKTWLSSWRRFFQQELIQPVDPLSTPVLRWRIRAW